MNDEYEKIINEKKIDKFILNNKYETENISSFISYMINNSYTYKDYKMLFISILDIKYYVDLPLVFFSLCKSEYDLEDLINVCSKLSLNIISKFRGYSSLIDILSLLLDISCLLYDKEWYFELSNLLHTISLFITNCNISNVGIINSYYKIISKIFLMSSNYYSAMNAMSMLNGDNLKDEYVGLIKYKNEGTQYSQLLLKMNYMNFNNDYQGPFGEYWDFYIRNRGNKVQINKDLISFMIKNDLEYTREGDFIILGDYCYKSMDRKVFNIIEMYEIKKEDDTKKEDDNKNVIKEKAINVIKEKAINVIKKKENIFKDNFTDKKIKYNIYCEILQDKFKEREINYKLRNENRKERFEKYIKNLKEKKDFFTQHKEDISSMMVELKLKKHKLNSVYISKAEISVRKNWRDEVDDVKPQIYKKKTEEFTSERNIYTYGDSYNKNSNAYVPNINSTNAYVPNINSTNAYVPNINTSNAYVPNIKSKDTLKSPDVYVPPSKNIKKKEELKNSTWYDENK